jgi:hypothetical protein
MPSRGLRGFSMMMEMGTRHRHFIPPLILGIADVGNARDSRTLVPSRMPLIVRGGCFNAHSMPRQKLVEYWDILLPAIGKDGKV